MTPHPLPLVLAAARIEFRNRNDHVVRGGIQGDVAADANRIR
jgi:hypothetical protein